ncbi:MULTISPECIES: 30S ribosomal protein S17 [Candidatus Ichthyocystis]|uniref:30S ribosomal protein S17 n=1 Tax=Candidatus Ichthyocystis TaxID=2929841 RepID=UPI000AB5ADD6|nr:MULTISPECIES: 30S ribosomal protein S17 [Ichthyocystis]
MERVSVSSSARSLVGRVVSDKMMKTVVVLVERRVRHAVYGKIVARSKKYHARNSDLSAKEGDIVEISECRPIAKTVSWRVTRLLDKARR